MFGGQGAEEWGMKKLTALAVGGAIALSSSSALAQTVEESDVTSLGDAHVTLITQETGPVQPGFDSWVSLQWMDDVTDATEFQVRATGGEGVQVGYPENTFDHSSLYWNDTLVPGEVDYTALNIRVDPSVTGPILLDVTLSYVSASGPVTVESVVEVPVQGDVVDGGLSYEDGSLGAIAEGEAEWVGQTLAADADVSGVEIKVVDDAGFDVSYPFDAEMAQPSEGPNLEAGDKDVARVQFDADGMEAGTYDVTLKVDYFVGSDDRTDMVTRQITVGDEVATTTTTAPTTTTEAPTTTAPTTTAAPTTEAPTTTVSVPTELFSDTSAVAWDINPRGKDKAKKGKFEVGIPELDQWTSYTNQPAGTPSGNPGLITDPKSSNGSGKHDVDGGETSASTGAVVLPDSDSITLSLSYYFSYLSNSSSSDYLKITIVGESGETVILDERGAAANRNAVWTSLTADLSAYAGEEITILVQAADKSGGSLVEAGVADISIMG